MQKPTRSDYLLAAALGAAFPIVIYIGYLIAY